jgi:hypothetical protein
MKDQKPAQKALNVLRVFYIIIKFAKASDLKLLGKQNEKVYA